MVDETIAPASPSPATPAASEAVSSPAPVSAPVVESTPAPVVEQTALGGEPVAAPVAVETPATEVKPAEVKPAVAPDAPVVEVKTETPQEGGPSEEPAPLPTYEAFKLPEGSKVEGDGLNNLTKLLGELETSKSDHAKFQEAGQSLIDMHVAEVQNTAKRLTEYYTAAFDKQKNDWKEAFINDPDLGGKRQETTINDAVNFIGKYAGTKEQQSEFRNFMNTTGVGNHPSLIRLIANANAEIARLTQESGKMLPGKAPVASTRSKVATRYGNAS